MASAELASGAFLAAVGGTVPFVQFITPFLAPLIAGAVALVIESVCHWFGRTVRFNWWFTMAFGVMAVSLLIWQSWSHGVPMAAMAEVPGQEGFQFRMAVVGFGVAVVAIVATMAYAGGRIVVDCIPITGILPGVLRLLPVVAMPVLLAWYVSEAVRVFENVAFHLFV